jgi:hypothetical protein
MQAIVSIFADEGDKIRSVPASFSHCLPPCDSIHSFLSVAWGPFRTSERASERAKEKQKLGLTISLRTHARTPSSSS